MNAAGATPLEDIDKRVRELEQTATRFSMLFDSPAGEGLLSQMKSALLAKLDAYASTVNTFIAGEPGRKQHIERNAQQAVLDSRNVAELALKTSEEKMLRLHEENKRDRTDDRREIERLAEKMNRHEKFVQRGVGVMIAGQLLILICGFGITCLTAMGGFLWFVVVHAHDIPIK